MFKQYPISSQNPPPCLLWNYCFHMGQVAASLAVLPARWVMILARWACCARGVRSWLVTNQWFLRNLNSTLPQIDQEDGCFHCFKCVGKVGVVWQSLRQASIEEHMAKHRTCDMEHRGKHFLFIALVSYSSTLPQIRSRRLVFSLFQMWKRSHLPRVSLPILIDRIVGNRCLTLARSEGSAWQIQLFLIATQVTKWLPAARRR